MTRSLRETPSCSPWRARVAASVFALVVAVPIAAGAAASVQSSASGANALSGSHVAFGASVRVDVAPTSAQIGQPVDVSFTVSHPTGGSVTWPDPAALPRSFAFVEQGGVRRERDPSDPAREISRRRWTLMALEGGTPELPALNFVVEVDGAKETVTSNPAPLQVAHALAPDEDAPRPLRAFRPTPEPPARRWPGLVAGLAAVPLVLLGAWVARRWRRRAPPPPPRESASARLAAVERAFTDDPAHARDAACALTRLVREVVDERAGTPRAAWTDAEWIAVVARDESLPAAARSTVARLLTAAERWKYASESPSPLLWRETVNDARVAIEAIQSAPKPATTPGKDVAA